MARTVAIAIAAGLLSAGLLLLTVTGSFGAMILAYLAPLPLFYAGLAYGVPAAAIAAATGTAISALAGVMAAGAFLAAFAAPVLLLVRQALLSRGRADGTLQWYPAGLMVAWLTGLAATLFLLAMALASSREGGLQGLFDAMLRQVASSFGEAERPLSESAASVLPAIVAVSWMLMIAVNGALAQGLAVRFGSNMRPSPVFARLTLPTWMVAALALAAAMALFPGTIGFAGRTLLVVVAVAYFLQGLAVMHALARRSRMPALLLSGLYVLLLVFGGPALLVAILGLIEEWARLRRRFAGAAAGEEE